MSGISVCSALQQRGGGHAGIYILFIFVLLFAWLPPQSAACCSTEEEETLFHHNYIQHFFSNL